MRSGLSFLVDRANLGRQTLREFQQVATPGDGRKFTDFYNVQWLTSNRIDPAERVLITTEQLEDPDRDVLRGDHRRMSPQIEGVWRQVIEYFDAYLVGLTATGEANVWVLQSEPRRRVRPHGSSRRCRQRPRKGLTRVSQILCRQGWARRRVDIPPVNASTPDGSGSNHPQNPKPPEPAAHQVFKMFARSDSRREPGGPPTSTGRSGRLRQRTPA